MLSGFCSRETANLVEEIAEIGFPALLNFRGVVWVDTNGYRALSRAGTSNSGVMFNVTKAHAREDNLFGSSTQCSIECILEVRCVVLLSPIHSCELLRGSCDRYLYQSLLEIQSRHLMYLAGACRVTSANRNFLPAAGGGLDGKDDKSISTRRVRGVKRAVYGRTLG